MKKIRYVLFVTGLVYGLMTSGASMAADNEIKKLTHPGPNYICSSGSPGCATDQYGDDGFGGAVAISGDYAIVTAPKWNCDTVDNIDDYDDRLWGTGWIFEKDQDGTDNWGMVTQLTSANPPYDPYGRNDHLGTSAAIDGTTAVMCSGELTTSTNWSAEYGACGIYYKDNGSTDGWGIQKWVQGHSQESQHYGYACAISGDYLIVGERAYGDWEGAAFIYGRNQGSVNNWGTLKTLSGFPEYAAFGVAVDVDGTASPVRVIVGADYSQNGHAGAAYIYEQGGTATTWTLVGGIKEGITTEDQFGNSVSIDGDWAVVGALRVANSGTNRGTVYIYQRDQGGAGTWGLKQTLTASDTADYDYFGSTVSIEGSTLLVGASGDDPAGTVYVFTESGGTWTQSKKLEGKNVVAGDSFGSYYSSKTSISLSGSYAIIGAYDTDGAYDQEGAAYISLI